MYYAILIGVAECKYDELHYSLRQPRSNTYLTHNSESKESQIWLTPHHI